jgi:hypothetical protein
MNLHRTTFAIVLIGVTAPGLHAQRGIMNPRGALTPGRGNGTLSREGSVQIPKYVNSVNVLVEHRQDLSLSDSQFVRLIAAKRSLDSTNAPLLRKLDSVQRVFKSGVPLFSSPSAQRRDSIAEARVFVAGTLGTVRDNISVARDKAYTVLSSTQLVIVRDLEEKAEKAVAAENERTERSAGRGGALGRPPTG